MRLTYARFTPYCAAIASTPGTSPVSIIRCQRYARAKATTNGERGPTSAVVAACGGKMISLRPLRTVNCSGTRVPFSKVGAELLFEVVGRAVFTRDGC